MPNKFEGHTPGDWQFTFENFNRIVIRNSDRDPIAQIYWGKKTAKANAELIAAAPRLLKAMVSIHGLLGNVDHSIGNGPNSAKMRGDLLNSIREIIDAELEG